MRKHIATLILALSVTLSSQHSIAMKNIEDNTTPFYITGIVTLIAFVNIQFPHIIEFLNNSPCFYDNTAEVVETVYDESNQEHAMVVYQGNNDQNNINNDITEISFLQITNHEQTNTFGLNQVVFKLRDSASRFSTAYRVERVVKKSLKKDRQDAEVSIHGQNSSWIVVIMPHNFVLGFYLIRAKSHTIRSADDLEIVFVQKIRGENGELISDLSKYF